VRKLIFALALGAILLPSQGLTLGLGEIEVNSSLNQQLAARIDLLSAVPEDAETLIVKLASREEFIRAGLDRPLIVTTLKFKTRVEGDRLFIDITTPKPVREPFLNFLMEVDWPKGHLLREYTILLDPPVFNGRSAYNTAGTSRPALGATTSAAPVATHSYASSDSGSPRTSAQATAAPALEMAARAPVQQSRYAPGDGYRIQEGDTAWSIANRIKPDSVSTQQMLVAMLKTNPEAFINENVNGLKRGYILRTPDAATINAMSYEEAKALVQQQNSLWREYQQSMASDQPASSVDGGYTESEYSSAVDLEDDSRLSIVSAGGGVSASGESKDPTDMSSEELREQLALTRERVETERVEKDNLKNQVGTLSEQVDKMKGLLTIEDDQLAEIQDAGKEDTVAVEENLEIQVASEEPVIDAGDEAALDALDSLKDEAEVDLTADEETKSAEAVEPVETADELFVDENAVQAVEADSMSEQDLMADEQMEAVQPVEESGLVDVLLNNRMILAGLLLVVLVIGAIVYLIKRRRAGSSDESEDVSFAAANEYNDEDALEDVADMIDDESVDDLVSDEEVEASMAEAEAEEEEFDAEATMILPSGTGTIISPAADLQPEEEEEKDDVLAEADVYLAYGIYQQAEELLQNAIQQNPDKDLYRVKLAETYFAGKNAEAFAKLGAETKERLGDKESPAWNKIVAMGKELCPEAEVFKQAGTVAEVDLDDMLPKSPEPMDFDLGVEAGGDDSLDLDFDAPLEETATADEFELPSMDDDFAGGMEETAIISPDAAPSESLDELEFDLSETDAVKEPAADEEEFSLDIEASELDLDAGEPATASADDAGLDMDFDMSMDTGSEEASLDMDMDINMSGEDEIDLSAEMSGGESLEDLTADLDMSMDDTEYSDTDDFSMDLDDADLDLSMDTDLEDMDLSGSLDEDEIGTKLDLARAYLDMGDNEGARDILDEVLADGNDAQKKEAEELMSQLG